MIQTTFLACSFAAAAAAVGAQPQGTAFTYQGRLTDNGSPATGTYDFRFILYDTPAGGSQVGPILDRDDVVVTDGLFTLPLDFGAAAFEGSARYLELGVRPGASTGAYSPIGPRQELTPAPAAIFSANTPWNGVSGKPPGFADDTDNDVVGGLACTNGQIPKWSGAAWFCSADEGTTYTAGAGLMLVSNVFSLADNGVTQTKIADSAVVSSKLANASVTNAKLADLAVDTPKLADLSVTTNKIQVGAVTTAQIAQGTIAFADLGQNGCALNEVVKWNGAAWACAADLDSGGDITSVTAGAGLTGGATTGAATLAVTFAGTGAATTVARSDHDHNAAYSPTGHTHVGETWTATATPVLTGTAGTGTALQMTTTSGTAASHGVEGVASSTSGDVAGVYGATSSTAGQGVFGEATTTAFAVAPVGVKGRATGAQGVGVYGSATSTLGPTMGVYGLTLSGSGYGVMGEATNTNASNSGVGVFGRSSSPLGQGVLGFATNTAGTGKGVRGVAQGLGVGVEGFGAELGVNGISVGGGDSATGVQGTSDAALGRGVYGHATAVVTNVAGVYGQSDGRPGRGVYGINTSTDGVANGVRGESSSSIGRGVVGLALATSGVNYGVFGDTNSPDGFAGFFNGDVEVTGILTFAATALRIDHPLDPEHKYLQHAAVVSSELKSFYDGVVTTGPDGYATVELPRWFEALNRDYRYQLTVVDETDSVPFVQAKVVRKIADGRFVIRTSIPLTEVSWLVTGIRRDSAAERRPLAVELVKPPAPAVDEP